jgi:Trk K+ transport system NAD-binding subunit
MVWRNRRAAAYLAGVVATIAAFTLLYNYGMTTWEGRPQPLYHSAEIVFQTLTTVGYGEDAPWQSPEMHVLVMTMQVAGLALILTGVDVFAVPWLQGALSPSPPTSAPDASDHVVVCEYTPRGEAFVAELEARDRAFVVIVSDRETALELHEADHPVVYGDPEATETLEAAGVERARALVADAADDTNASIVLAATEVNPELRCLTLIEDRSLADYHRIAGADEVFSPRQLLGESLAQQVPTAVTTTVDDAVEVAEDFQLVEFPIDAGSELDGVTLTESHLRARTGVHVVGAWFTGEFRTPVEPDAELDADTTLLVAGRTPQLERLEELTATAPRELAERTVIIAGLGEAGSAAAAALDVPGIEVTRLDVEDGPDVDVVGDARDPDALDAAGIDTASTVIFAVSDDTTAVFATLVARDRNPDADILVRANDERNTARLYRAGADYVQSLARVSGRMLASTVFEDEEVLAYDRRVELVRVSAGDLAGRTLADARVRERTGCTVVAVERGDETLTAFDPETFTFEADDALILAGADERIAAFEQTFGG